MAGKSLVTIVTPSFNQGEFLKAAIESVLEQTYAPIQYIVMDGGSSDGSAEIIQSYADRLDYWQSAPDGGQTDAINQGFARAKGKYMGWLNSDDVYLPHAVEEAVEILEASPPVGLVYGQAEYINEKGEVVGQFGAAQTDYGRLMRGYVHIPQQAAFWRADLWEQVSPLDTDLHYAMDYELWVGLARLSELRYHQRVWGQFRIHGEAKTILGDAGFWPEMLKVHEREGGSWLSIMRLKYFVRRMLAPMIQRRRRRLMQ